MTTVTPLRVAEVEPTPDTEFTDLVMQITAAHAGAHHMIALVVLVLGVVS